jgi:hypothetical protein
MTVLDAGTREVMRNAVRADADGTAAGSPRRAVHDEQFEKRRPASR